MFLIAREGGREVLWLSAGENLCATSSTFAGRRHMIGKVVTGCVAILPYHTATQDRGSEYRDFGFISRIVTALIYIIIMMIDKNQVQSHYIDECNCIHDRKDASRNELLHVLEVVKLIQL